MNDILLAYEGHLDKLKILHGSSEDQDEKPKIEDAETFAKVFGKKGVIRE